MSGKVDDAIAQGTPRGEGRTQALGELLALTSPPEFWFPIITRPAWKA